MDHCGQEPVRMVFDGLRSIPTLFRFKSSTPVGLQSKLIRKYTCSTCQVDCTGSIAKLMCTGIGEHLGISTITNKPLSSKDCTVIKKHLLDTGHVGTEDDFEVIYSVPKLNISKSLKPSAYSVNPPNSTVILTPSHSEFSL